jgi:hypothetical protein
MHMYVYVVSDLEKRPSLRRTSDLETNLSDIRFRDKPIVSKSDIRFRDKHYSLINHCFNHFTCIMIDKEKLTEY